jgi:hypothetical protein
MSAEADLLEVVTPATGTAVRRLTTAAYVSARMEGAPDSVTLESYIDEVSAQCAAYCGLARDAAGTPPTFATESLRATWYASHHRHRRGDKLLVPWRIPVTEIASVIEGGVTLDADTEYRLLSGGMLLRLCSDAPACWPLCKIVVEYTAGWENPSANAPADLQAAVAEQVKFRVMSLDRDPAVLSESVPDAYSASYAMRGVNNVGTSGLLLQVEAALTPYRQIVV